MNKFISHLRSNNKRVIFLNKDSLVKFKCPICSGFTRKVKLILWWGRFKLRVISCSCGTIFFPGASAPNYQVVEDETSFYLRLDQAEGIDAAVSPVFVSPELKDFAVVDVGCGLGFGSEYLKFLGRKCIAFDPSLAATYSRKHLKIDISPEFATRNNSNSNERKIAYASEVIEHVEDPFQFLLNLKEIAGGDGFVMLTTPNADFLNNEISEELIFAMLAPSQHLFLLSSLSLELLAKKAGFAWFATWSINERLFMIAGPTKISIENDFSRNDFIDFLEFKLNDEKLAIEFRFRAFGYRLFKEYVNSGRYSEALGTYNDLSTNYFGLGFDLAHPFHVVEKLNKATLGDRIIPSAKEFPYNLAIIFYLRGILLICQSHDSGAARVYFEAAIEISEMYSRIFEKQNFQLFDLEIQNVRNWSLREIQQHCL
jgi:2-polyprenyl-3-methyl-5-hydroxy-6-metoxy-1,4-benzoquinol methylase